ncbi:site-specific integrase, partial [Bacillus sp. AFS017336]|uniref:tyrosine-type recombinase/integrase n=1 Tax=Bacillus sp. AFS017336 TaxID=2033489 RepID=UPI000BFB056D
MENMYIKSYLLEMQIRSQSPVTVNCKRYILKYFERYLKGQGVSIEDVTTLTIKEWIVSQHVENNGELNELNNESETRGRKTEKLKSSTINTRLKVLKNFYEFLVEEGEIKKNPMEKIKFLKQDKHFIQAYKQKDVKSMLNHYNNKTFLSSRNKLCIMLLASCFLQAV